MFIIFNLKSIYFNNAEKCFVIKLKKYIYFFLLMGTFEKNTNLHVPHPYNKNNFFFVPYSCIMDTHLILKLIISFYPFEIYLFMVYLFLQII